MTDQDIAEVSERTQDEFNWQMHLTERRELCGVTIGPIRSEEDQ